MMNYFSNNWNAMGQWMRGWGWNGGYNMTNGQWPVDGGFLAIFGSLVVVVIMILAVWVLLWKGWALWKAAKNGAKVWFVVLLLVNTLGILEILYIFIFSKKSWGKK